MSPVWRYSTNESSVLPVGGKDPRYRPVLRPFQGRGTISGGDGGGFCIEADTSSWGNYFRTTGMKFVRPDGLKPHHQPYGWSPAPTGGGLSCCRTFHKICQRQIFTIGQRPETRDQRQGPLGPLRKGCESIFTPLYLWYNDFVTGNEVRAWAGVNKSE